MKNYEKLLREENNLKEKGLTKENNRILTDIVVYLHSGSLCEYDIEIIRKELVGMALEAQIRNETFKNVIGEDYKAFCDELMINGRKKSTYEKFLSLSHVCCGGLFILFLWEVICHFASIIRKYNFSSSLLVLPVNLGFIISGFITIIAAYIIFYFIAKNSFSILANKKYKFGFICLYSTLFSIILLSKVLLDKVVLLYVNIFYPLAIIGFMFIVIKLLESKHSKYLAETHR